MKILIASDFFSPTINGVVTSIINLQKELEAHGHEVKILTLRQGKNYGYEECVYVIPSISAGRFYPGARMMRSLGISELRDIMEWKPDVIHTNNEFSTFFLVQLISAKLDIPIVHTYHTVYEDYVHYFSPNEVIGKGLVRKLSHNLMARVDSIVVPTQKVKDILDGYDIETPIYVVPSGIDLDVFKNVDHKEARVRLREKYGVGQDEFLMLFLGRLAKEKSIEEIMEYMEGLDPSIRLMIVGGGPYTEILKNYAQNHDLEDRIIFTGMVPMDEVPGYYHMVDVFVSASTSETQGLTYIEALASGLPAVCRKDSVLEEVIYNGVNGWQFEDEAEFVSAITELVRNRELAGRMSQAAREISEHFSTEAFYNGIIKVYEETIARPIKQREPLPSRLRSRMYPSIFTKGEPGTNIFKRIRSFGETETNQVKQDK